jgi:DNA repair photolyase
MDIYTTRLQSGITRSREFERKRLASFAVNVGTKCGHGCCYCSTGPVLRMSPSFKAAGRSPFESGYAIVDPDTPERVARDARRFKHQRGLVQLCTLTDAWSPEAQAHHLGRRCLEAILAEPGWTVRILTKNAAVRKDFDIIERYRDRVLFGVSITASADRGQPMSAVEPYASPIMERIAVMTEAHARGLRAYAMFCPVLPGIADSPEQIDQLVRLAVEFGAEETFAEPVNARGTGLRLTQEALESHGYASEAAAIGRIRQREQWCKYVVGLIASIQRSMRTHSQIERLRLLLYPSVLSAEAIAQIRADDAGVVWLGKEQP